MSQVIDDAAFRRLRDGPDILIAIARPPRRLPLGLAIPMGIMTYQVEKAWRGPVHPAWWPGAGLSARVSLHSEDGQP